MVGQIISYSRASTAAQGKSGLGIEAQRDAIARFAATEGLTILAEFVEIETGKGADTIDKADTTRRFSALSIVSALAVVSCPPRMAAAGSGADAPPSVDCVSNVTAGERTDEPSPPPTTEEPDEPTWPAPGTPERARLDRENAAICAGLLAGYHRHRAALAHTLSDKVQATYRRGDLMEKRGRLMADWAGFCGRPATPAEVIPLRGAG